LLGPELIRFLRAQDITVVTLPPSALAALPAANLPALRIVNVAGETCPADLVRHWRSGRQFFNLYGPTEATVWATSAELLDNHRPPHIGRPIGNTKIYVLDANLQPVPIGVPGEMFIGGLGVTRGYLNRPELTAERFLPDPFASEPGARVYKTGDRARLLPDGNIEFLGRMDNQVKVHGFRIELEEIEMVLGQHPAIREAVVVVREDQPGNKRLVAYVAPTAEDRGLKIEDSGSVAEESLSSILHHPSSILSDLRRFLKERLPEYMLPSTVVFLDADPQW